MSATPPAARIWVGVGFVLSLAFILAALWWTASPKLITTSDAIWHLPDSGSVEGQEKTPPGLNSSEVLGEVKEMATSAGGLDSPAKSPEVEAAEETLSLAEAELQNYLQTMQLVRDAIAEAVVMVQEQRENFDYALERFETLMPLVETGALEPLAASQIQSAYISARASLAQAKFLLGQVRREFGTEESRRLTHRRLQRQIAMAREELGRVRPPVGSPAPGVEGMTVPPPGERLHAPPLYGFIDSVFVVSGEEMESLGQGSTAMIYSPGQRGNAMPVPAKVEEILRMLPDHGANSHAVRVRLLPSAPPSWETFGRARIPCRVVILPTKEPS